MNARKVYTLLVIVMIAFSVVSPAAAAGPDPVYIHFHPGAEYTINPGQVAIISDFILSGEPGALRQFVRSIDTQQYYLNNQLLLSTQDSLSRWNNPIRSNDQPTLCATGYDWISTWNPYTLDLPPGEYELRKVYSTNKGLTDACDYDGDGHPEGFPNPPFSSDVTVIIHVME